MFKLVSMIRGHVIVTILRSLTSLGVTHVNITSKYMYVLSYDAACVNLLYEKNAAARSYPGVQTCSTKPSQSLPPLKAPRFSFWVGCSRSV